MERHVQEALNQMSTKMNLPPFQINGAGVIYLVLENAGELFIDVQPNAVYTYIFNTFDFLDYELTTEAMSFCGLDTAYTIPANPVLRGDHDLGFAIKITTEDLTLVNLEGAINQLIDMAVHLRKLSIRL
ncbi:MAG: hypothetical protein K2L24_02900 [Opitutales bacterium]|nr:hypothetical protein [Opitutales bacterium]